LQLVPRILSHQLSIGLDRFEPQDNNDEMLPLLLAVIVFFFLLVGAVVFLTCVLIAPLRRYALSAALWCATWGPSSVGFLLLAGTAVIAEPFFTQSGDMQSLHAPTLVAALGWGYLTTAVLVTTAVASAAAWLHQTLMHRLTFALFRLYATVVCAGIGSVFGWCLGWLMAWRSFHLGLPLWIAGMLTLIFGLGTAAYRGARSLRGEPPEKFTWISAEEFNGT
jgi:hypothetical protein